MWLIPVMERFDLESKVRRPSGNRISAQKLIDRHVRASIPQIDFEYVPLRWD
jgi:hypothetical protein